MNLVAKEFVACRTKCPGVLILSPFAGAGETMQEALSVNPYEISNMAAVLHRYFIYPTISMYPSVLSLHKIKALVKFQLFVTDFESYAPISPQCAQMSSDLQYF